MMSPIGKTGRDKRQWRFGEDGGGGTGLTGGCDELVEAWVLCSKPMRSSTNHQRDLIATIERWVSASRKNS